MNDAVSVPGSSRRGAAIVFGAILIAITALLVLLAVFMGKKNERPLDAGLPPDFTLTTFDGQSLSLSHLRGKAVVINFWASWCIPCRDEAPALERAWQTYRDRGLVVLGVDYVDVDADAKKFIAQFGQTYPNGPDTGTRISQTYRITGVPETYFVGKDGRLLQGIDANGRVKGNWIGPLPEQALIERVEEMLKQ